MTDKNSGDTPQRKSEVKRAGSASQNRIPSPCDIAAQRICHPRASIFRSNPLIGRIITGEKCDAKDLARAQSVILAIPLSNKAESNADSALLLLF